MKSFFYKKSGFPRSRFWPFVPSGFAARPKFTTGFTLVEMIVSVAIFSMVVVISTSAILTIVRANQKVRITKSVMENLNFALESMSRSIRFSTNYHCSSLGVVTDPRDCPYPNGSSTFVFKDYQDGKNKGFLLQGTTIEKSDEFGNLVPMTAPDVTVTRLSFYVEGAESSTAQPKVKVIIQGFIGASPSISTSFNIQTTISQRPIIF